MVVATEQTPGLLIGRGDDVEEPAVPVPRGAPSDVAQSAADDGATVQSGERSSRPAEEQVRLAAAAEAEAKERRRTEAEKFAAEQEQARTAQQQREAEEITRKRAASKALNQKIFGGFRKKR
jgi:hypothetical protein